MVACDLSELKGIGGIGGHCKTTRGLEGSRGMGAEKGK